LGRPTTNHLTHVQPADRPQDAHRASARTAGTREHDAAARGTRETAGPDITIVIPTRNEADNVAPLVGALELVRPDLAMEVIFVDDSSDDTPEAVETAAARSSRDIRLIHREPGSRAGGLGTAVIAGIAAARAPWVCVMDGDLQHPPAKIAELLERAEQGDVDLVAASRFREESAAAGLGRIRTLVSHSLIASARLMFPLRLRGVSDPLTGFFLVRRDALELDDLRPRGFKILLEILIRTKKLRATEIPFDFGDRHAGESKASVREAGNYFVHLFSLRGGSFGKFGVVGVTGLAVNALAMALFDNALGVHYLFAAILATQVSSAWNLGLTELWVFHGREHRRDFRYRATSFFAMNNIAFLVRGPLIVLFTAALGINPVVSNLLSLIALTLVRFAIADSWIWSGPQKVVPNHLYSIHDKITIESPTQLPELERFRVPSLSGVPTITIRHAKVERPQGRKLAEFNGDTMLYHEGGPGFAARVEMGEQIYVTASPLLRHSPHVLYTNVVEPVLRWRFVEQGMALVHAACVGYGDQAFLITARTDTGKTTTILRTLDNYPQCSFLSDDLTLVSPDGRVLTYPKPLTISRHTLVAVKTPLLSRKERAALIVQSRLHSKSGRVLGLMMARIGIRAATLNALVQWMVPPPKYQVDRLVPGVTIAHDARLAGMVVIQRDGEESRVKLEEQQALEILLRNCDDAYTFPPYPTVEGFLHSRHGLDLKARERSIIEQAMASKPASLLCSQTRDWWKMLPEVVSEGLDATGENGDGRVAVPVRRVERRATTDRRAGVDRRQRDERRDGMPERRRGDRRAGAHERRGAARFETAPVSSPDGARADAEDARIALELSTTD
jgi:dolichol-phosphate mannosyltransferase